MEESTAMQLGPPTDAAALDALFASIEAADGVPALTEYKIMRYRDHGEVGVALTTADDVTIGYVQVAHHPGGGAAPPGHWAVEIAVDPSCRSPATYEPLIREGAASVPPDERYVVWAWHDALQTALEQAGYTETRRLLRLECPLPVEATAPVTPGVTIRAFEVDQDEAAWLRVNNAAFAGHPENGAVTLADLEERFRRPWFDPADLLMAWEGSELLGSCWTKHHPLGVGEIYIVGVSPQAQGRGLGRELVVRGLDHLYRTGSTTGMLYVDGDNKAAMWLYSDLGFRPIRANRQYERVEA